jgi:mannose-6-phosphate isomerase
MAFPLRAEVKHYDWGVPGALSIALGLEPSDKPEAELWWGNHALAGCFIETPEGLVDFTSWLEKSHIPFRFLVKLLAARKPLSIQVHPSEEQAQQGFQLEQARGIPLDARERTYKDISSKPELVIALSDEFVGLSGFVEDSVVGDRLERWDKAGAPDVFLSVMAGLASEPRVASRVITQDISGRDDVIQGLEGWLRLVDPSTLDAVAAQEVHLLQKVSSAHPGDEGILFVPLMHHVYLQRGEALFIPAGEVHAYVEGFGLEVMLPSDNVIRAGLTSKHKDTAAFLELASFAATSAPRLHRPVGDEFSATYEGFGADFVIHSQRSGAEALTITNPSVCFVEAGKAVVGGLESTTLLRGDAAFALPGETVVPQSEDAVVWVVHSRVD